MRQRSEAGRRAPGPWIAGAALAVAVVAGLGCDSSVDIGPLRLPTVPEPPIGPAGPTVTETRAISGVNAVSLAAVGLVDIAHGPLESLTITAPVRVIGLLTSEVVVGRLVLDRSSSSYQGQASDIRYDLSLRRLDELRLPGVGAISATGVDSATFVVDLSGIGDIRAAGRADRQEVTVSGLGGYYALDLRSREVEVHMTSGSVVVWATERITGYVAAGCVLEYRGDPEIAVHGEGTLRRLGPKR